MSSSGLDNQLFIKTLIKLLSYVLVIQISAKLCLLKFIIAFLDISRLKMIDKASINVVQFIIAFHKRKARMGFFFHQLQRGAVQVISEALNFATVNTCAS